MKTFRTIQLIILSLLIYSCKNTDNKISGSETGFTSFFKTKETMYEFKDVKTGLTVSSIEYPNDWKVISKAQYDPDPVIPFFMYQIQGPSNIKIFNTPLKMFYASPNPQMEHNMRNSGMQNVRSLTTVEKLLENEIAPRLSAQGFSFETLKPLPEWEENFNQKVHESAPQAETKVLSTQWIGANGQKAVSIISFVKMNQPLFTGDVAHIWMYATDFILADNDQFEDVIETFVKANIQVKENPEWKNHIASINNQRQEESRRQRQQQIENMNNATRQMTINHQNNMAQRQASFNAHQQRMTDMSAARDASHASFMNNNFGSGSSSSGYSSGGQQSFLNMINEEETVYNPNGNTYQIEAGAKETWMDNNGNYINSNDLFFDPNASLNNTTEWTKVNDDY